MHGGKCKMKNRKWLYIFIYLRMIRLIVSAWSLLLTSSVRVATLAMQPQLVQPWKGRVQHLRQLYCKRKYTQKGTSHPAYSRELYPIPVLVMVWLVLICCAVVLDCHRESVMSTVGEYLYLSSVVARVFIIVIPQPESKYNNKAKMQSQVVHAVIRISYK